MKIDAMRSRRRYCDEYVSLDIKDLDCHRVLEPSVSTGMAHLLRGMLELTGGHQALIVHGRYPFQERMVIAVETMPMRYGGRRHWILCPDCRVRRRVLYGPTGAGGLSCRGCLGLVYRSQDERKIERVWRKERSLLAKLGNSSVRPKGMRVSMFERLHAQLATIRERELKVFSDGARRLLNSRGWPAVL